MKLATIENWPGKNYEILGLVKGTVVQSKNLGKDFMAGMKTLVGGEIVGYTEMIVEARAIATKRMVDEAEALDADAVIGVRYERRQGLPERHKNMEKGSCFDAAAFCFISGYQLFALFKDDVHNTILLRHCKLFFGNDVPRCLEDVNCVLAGILLEDRASGGVCLLHHALHIRAHLHECSFNRSSFRICYHDNVGVIADFCGFNTSILPCLYGCSGRIQDITHTSFSDGTTTCQNQCCHRNHK